jgi:hypothetical protein
MTTPRGLTETDRANGALAEIGEPPIAALSDPGRAAARHCNRFFAGVRDELLREAPWQFAKNYVTPAAQPTAPSPRWLYRYLMPADCVNIVCVMHRQNAEWEQNSSGDDATVAICLDTNLVAPNVWYTRRIVNPAQWDALFCELFDISLAAKINPLIGRDKSKTAELLQRRRDKLEETKARDAQSASAERQRKDVNWILARYGVPMGLPPIVGPAERG